jgi:hypothetical protein
MNSFKTKLALAAVGIAVLATPAFAQRQHRQAQPQDYNATQSAPFSHYPNGAQKTGSGDAVDSGAMFNTENY